MLLTSALSSLTSSLTLMSIVTATPAINSFPESSRNATTRSCNPNAPGCSACTECCVLLLQFDYCEVNTLNGIEDIWHLDDTIKPNGGSCQVQPFGPITAVWMSECTGGFGGCTLWQNSDCSGDNLFVTNDANVCSKTWFNIGAIKCYNDEQ